MDITDLPTEVQEVINDPEVLARFSKGDSLAFRKNKHDRAHAETVLKVGLDFIAAIMLFRPDLLDEETRKTVIPLQLYLHDNGYADSDEDHAVAGGGWAFSYLLRKGFSKSVARRVGDGIANHRSKRVLAQDFDDPANAVTVLADKSVGDEDRVRFWPAIMLRILRMFGLCRFWRYHKHERANLAITNAEVVTDGTKSRSAEQSAAFVLKLSFDSGFYAVTDILDLYKDRFCASDKAAQYLRFLYRVEFNGVRFMYVEAQKSWVPVKTISVTTPE